MCKNGSVISCSRHRGRNHACEIPTKGFEKSFKPDIRIVLERYELNLHLSTGTGFSRHRYIATAIMLTSQVLKLEIRR